VSRCRTLWDGQRRPESPAGYARGQMVIKRYNGQIVVKGRSDRKMPRGSAVLIHAGWDQREGRRDAVGRRVGLEVRASRARLLG
jgi:hypothetical protein